MAPKKKVKHSKTQKNKPWTDKQTNVFAAVLSSTESFGCLSLRNEAQTANGVINELWFSRKIYFDASELLNWKLLLRFFEPKRQFEI